MYAKDNHCDSFQQNLFFCVQLIQCIKYVALPYTLIKQLTY